MGQAFQLFPDPGELPPLPPIEPPIKLPQLLTPDEIYDRAEQLIPLLQEDRRIERKPGGIHKEPLGEYFSMWANTSPDGGLIALGRICLNRMPLGEWPNAFAAST